MIEIFNKINFLYKNLDNVPIRLLTFQSKEVVDILLENKIYLADTSKSREQQNYKLDIEQLNGANPIWCFSPLDSKNNKLRFIKEDFVDGSLFFNYGCEMSLPSGAYLNDLYLMEIEVPANCVYVGLTHNAYSKAVVIPKIEISNLVAIYILDYDRKREVGWYYPMISIVQIFKENPLFTEDFLCHEIKNK